MAQKNVKCMPNKTSGLRCLQCSHIMSDLHNVFSFTDVQTRPNKPAALRVILQDHMIDKLVLPCGIPETVDELQSIVQQKYSLEPGKFTLHYNVRRSWWGKICLFTYIVTGLKLLAAPQLYLDDG